jgi:DNA-binding NtrC family response regulator
MARVLVVDDEPDYPQLLSIILGAEGFEVQTATTGAEAMRVVDHFLPDVLIVDWALAASENGLDLAGAVESRNPRLRTILITGYPLPSLGALAERLPRIEFLAKPFTPAELVAMVRAAAGSA